jgi:ABC-type lipoprotein export system ATPase subunit
MRIKQLSFKFDKEKTDYFFNNATVDFVPSAVNFIQGDNGVGKSTLFSIVRGALDAKVLLDASIEMGGVTYTSSSNRLPDVFVSQVHMVHQNYDAMLAQECTFKENLQLANLPKYPGLCSLPRPTFFAAIDALGIDMNRPVHLLSGGQRQILAILMALQKPTKLLLLDEPTATLDSKNAQLIMSVLHTLSEQLGVTALVICHDKELVKQYAQVPPVALVCDELGERVFVF